MDVRITNKLETDSVTVTGLGETITAVASFSTEGIDRIGIQMKVISNLLDQFEIHVKYGKDGDYINLGLVNADFTTPNHPVVKSNITSLINIPVGEATCELDVSSYYAVQLWAASGSVSGSDLIINGGGK